MAIERKLEAKVAKSVFYHHMNEIDIYIEDTAEGVEKFYDILFSRALKDKYKIGRVFQVGNKEKVVKACISDTDPNPRPRLYIIDGDLDILMGEVNTGTPRLLTLDRYCIENYLVDENALCDVLYEEDLTLKPYEVVLKVDFKNFILEIETNFLALFVIYAIIKKESLGIPTISYRSSNLLRPGSNNICSNLVSARHQSLETQILSRINREQFELHKANFLRRVGQCKHKFISAKDYIFPILLRRARAIVNFQTSNRVIFQKLAMRCDITDLCQSAMEVISSDRTYTSS